MSVNNGYHSRYANSFDHTSLLPQYDQSFTHLKINCSSPFSKLPQKHFSDPFCAANTTKPTFLVLGDSHVLSFSYSAMISPHLKMVMATLSGNPTFLDHVDPLTDPKDARFQKIKRYQQYIKNLIESYSSIEYVVLISMQPLPTITEDAYIEGYVKIINFLSSLGKKVIFVIDFPTLDINPNSCINRSINLSKKQDCLIDKKALMNSQKEYRALINRIHKKVPSLLIYDPTAAFCDRNVCYGKKDRILYYGDQNHLNLEGSSLLMQHFKEWLKSHNIDH